MTERIAVEPLRRVHVQHQCQDRRDDANHRHPTVTHLQFGEDTEEEHTQQRTVCVRRHLIYSVDHRLVVQHKYDIDQCCHQYRHAYMHPRTGLLDGFLAVFVYSLVENIYRKRGCQCRQRTTRSRVACSDETHHKQYPHYQREIVACSQESKHVISLQHLAGGTYHIAVRISHSLACSERVQHITQRQERVDNYHLYQCAYYDVLLRITMVLARQRTLHHILVQTRSGHQHEDARKKLLPEKLRVVHIVEIEHPGHRTVAIALQRHTATHDIHDAQHHRQNQARCL